MNEKEFIQRLAKNNLPVVVDFWADWCSPCKSIEPTLKNLGQEYMGWVDLWRVNVEENQELRTAINILGLPTLIVYRGEKEVTRCTGAASKTILNQLFETAISGVAPTQPAYILRERLVRTILIAAKAITRVEKRVGDETTRKAADSISFENTAG